MLDFFEDHQKQKRIRREKAQQQPVVEVTAIIPPHGVSRVQSRGSPAEENVIFYIWRVGTGHLEKANLRLVQEIDGEIPRFASLRGLAPDTVITVKTRLLRAKDEAFALVAGDAEIVEPDPVIAEALQVQKSPTKLDDPLLGTLTADLLLGWVGEAQWLGDSCKFCISHLDDLSVAHALWNEQRRWTSEAIGLATNRLLSLKNEEWLREGEQPLSPAEFSGRLTLNFIAVEPNGEFALEFDDGALFWGHTVTIQGSLSDGLTDADLAG
jgi:hypothetical protein